jgi:hypothetical protein
VPRAASTAYPQGPTHQGMWQERNTASRATRCRIAIGTKQQQQQQQQHRWLTAVAGAEHGLTGDTLQDNG